MKTETVNTHSLEYQFELTNTCIEACKAINKENPLNVAKAIPELFEALKAVLMWHKGYGTKTQSEIMRLYVEPAIQKATEQ
jgi:hypothetical protein